MWMCVPRREALTTLLSSSLNHSGRTGAARHKVMRETANIREHCIPVQSCGACKQASELHNVRATTTEERECMTINGSIQGRRLAGHECKVRTGVYPSIDIDLRSRNPVLLKSKSRSRKSQEPKQPRMEVRHKPKWCPSEQKSAIAYTWKESRELSGASWHGGRHGA